MRISDGSSDVFSSELVGQGKVADYIPILAQVPAARCGMALATVDGRVFEVGDAGQPFSIQSISKVFTLTMALEAAGDDLWQRVGREPSGNAFNSLGQLERELVIPRTRSEERRVGQECVRTCRSRGCGVQKKKKKK